MLERVLGFWMVAAFSITACADAAPNDPLPRSGCDVSTLAAGTTTSLELELDGSVRTFKVHVPTAYAGTSRVPLLFVVHGYTQTSREMIAGTDMVPLADREGFVAIFPDGVAHSWNAGACCGGNDEDDVGFFRAMVAYAQANLCIDGERVYASGYSNGGMMSYRLACEASDVFAAIASVAGGFTASPDACASSREHVVPALHLHGDADPIVPYASALSSVDAYGSISGCDATSSPAVQPASGGDTTCITRDGCEPGAEVTMCTVAGGGHCWFGNATCGTGIPGAESLVGNNAEDIVASEAIWGFLSRFSCPTCGD